MPEMTDLYGLPVTGADDAALQGIDDFVHGFISFQTKAANVLKAAEAAPDCALINAYAAILYMLLEAPVAPQLAAPFCKPPKRPRPMPPPRTGDRARRTPVSRRQDPRADCPVRGNHPPLPA